MTRGILTPQRVLVALVLLMLISSLLPAKASDKLAMLPRWIVSHLLAPATGPLTWMSARVGGTTATPLISPDARSKFEENYFRLQNNELALLQENELLRQEIVRLSQIPERIRKAVTLLPARVVAAPSSRLDPVLTINRGRSHGVEQNMIATSGYNLVGLVIGVDNTQSRVRLITAPTTTMAVTILPQLAPPGSDGLKATVKMDATRRTLVANVRKEDQVQVDDLVHLWDQTWPKEAAGYIVGRVVEVIDNPADPILRRLVVIRPVVDLQHLTQVDVVAPKESS